jgi:hypothetical protein
MRRTGPSHAGLLALLLLFACDSTTTRGTGDAALRDGPWLDHPPPGVEWPVPGAEKTPPAPPPKATCTDEGGTAAVQKPVFWKNLGSTGTSWFASSAIVDLDGDGKSELVGAFYDLIVWDANGTELTRAKSCSSGCSHNQRIYAPAVIADLDGDKVMEIVVGADDGVAAYEFKSKKLSIKSGWPQKAVASGQDAEVRGLAAADLDGDGKIEVVATTTIGGEGSQVWVFSPGGQLFQPAGLTKWKAWPRYNQLTGEGGDADANAMGHDGFGCYGLNVGIGNIDDDKLLEIIVTYDNHLINAFKPDGTSKRASSWYTNPQTQYLGKPLDWGQFIRWADMTVEDNHYHAHSNDPNPGKGDVWLQWTDSPPNVVDLNGDGRNEVVGVARAETHEPYQTIYNAFMALEGDYAAAPDRGARRVAGWEVLPKTKAPQARSGDYPPGNIAAPTSVDLDGDKLPETIAPGDDGVVYAISPGGKVLWSYDAHQATGKTLTYATEVVAADLNKDGKVELIFATWGDPKVANSGYLVILDASGNLVHALAVPNQGQNGNGIGLPAAPGVGDLDGDGQLEIAVQSFDHGLDLFRVPGSGTKCLPWPTGRGNLLRNGQGPLYK